MYKVVKKENGKPLTEKEEAELFERNIDIYNKLIGRDENYYGKIEQQHEEEIDNSIEEEDKKDNGESNEQSVSSDFVDINKA